MLDKKFDFLIFIGRLQPFHLGHQAVIQKALELANKVIILCGSGNSPRTIRNPWTTEEREEMIRRCFTLFDNNRIVVKGLNDIMYNDNLWIKSTIEAVESIVSSLSDDTDLNIGLIGHEKDSSSYYLNLFPNWQFVNVENETNISSTSIRDDYLSNKNLSSESIAKLPKAVYDYLMEFSSLPYYNSLFEEENFIKQYKQSWSKAPYPPIFVTVDALVIQSKHILLIKRKNFPGKNLFALPGGFVNQDEKLIDACIRELKEETNLNIPNNDLKYFVRSSNIFDNPHRSMLGRVLTYVFYIELPNKNKPNDLENVKAGDDADEAFWLPLNQLNSNHMHDDHFHIIRNMLKIL